MTTVYVLEGYLSGEGYDVLGVYSTMESATSAKEEYSKKVDDGSNYSMIEYDAYNIQRVTLDSPASP